MGMSGNVKCKIGRRGGGGGGVVRNLVLYRIVFSMENRFGD